MHVFILNSKVFPSNVIHCCASVRYRTISSLARCLFADKSACTAALAGFRPSSRHCLARAWPDYVVLAVGHPGQVVPSPADVSLSRYAPATRCLSTVCVDHIGLGVLAPGLVRPGDVSPRTAVPTTSRYTRPIPTLAWTLFCLVSPLSHVLPLFRLSATLHTFRPTGLCIPFAFRVISSPGRTLSFLGRIGRLRTRRIFSFYGI